MPDPRPTRALLFQIDQTKDRIAKERDKLRDLIADLEQIAEGSDRAVSALEEAADALSELL